MRRIDEHEIEVLEPRFGIVGDEIRRLRHRAVVANDDPLGPERAEVQPDRRGARSAVEDETDRTGVRRRIGQEIRRREDRRLGIAALVVQSASRHGNELRDRTILERAAVLHDAAFALARIARKKLVDFFAQPFFRIVAVAWSRCRFAHDISPSISA